MEEEEGTETRRVVPGFDRSSNLFHLVIVCIPKMATAYKAPHPTPGSPPAAPSGFWPPRDEPTSDRNPWTNIGIYRRLFTMFHPSYESRFLGSRGPSASKKLPSQRRTESRSFCTSPAKALRPVREHRKLGTPAPSGGAIECSPASVRMASRLTEHVSVGRIDRFWRKPEYGQPGWGRTF